MKTFSAVFICLLAVPLYLFADFRFSYPGCQDITNQDFDMVHLIRKGGENHNAVIDTSLHEPIGMDFDPIYLNDSITKVNIFFIERLGNLKFFDAQNKTVTIIGKLDVNTNRDLGITGIALDPNFKSNRMLYLYLSPNSSPERMRLSRFQLNPDFNIDLSSELNMFEIIANNAGPHQGGPMDYDSDGNLYIAVGNDSPDHDPNGFSHISDIYKSSSDEWGASNTANMRGSILKIKTDVNDPRGYTIPKNNFGEYWAKYFDSLGNSTVATEYRDPSKVLPEIYTKGHRSNFSITVDPKFGWLTWGEVGPWLVRDPAKPNGPHDTEEFNLVKHPVFGGYPYFAGNQLNTGGHTKNPLAPINNSPFNTGVQQLPPADVPLFSYGTQSGMGIVAVTGPIYRFDPNLKSQYKFPPHMDGKWFVTDWSKNWIQIYSLDAAGKNVLRNDTVFEQHQISAPLDFHAGPDGSLYIINYAGSKSSSNFTGLARFNYVGPDCQGPLLVKKNQKINSVKIIGNQIISSVSGQLVFDIIDITGALVKSIKSPQKTIYSLEKILPSKNQIYFLKVKTSNSTFVFKVNGIY